MDWGSLAGIAIALAAVLLGQTLEGGHLSSLVQPAAFVIVILGTAGAVLLQTGLSAFMRGIMMIGHVFRSPPDEQAQLVRDVGLWSFTARREGLLSLERFLDRMSDPFAARGLRLVVDGFDGAKLRDVLEIEIDSYETHQRRAIRVWEAAGGYAPTVGILGAVLGLIHVMENLSDPTRLGSGIAVAFVATIYGVGLANLLFLPVSNKLKAMTAIEVRRLEMLTDGICGIAAGENPRIIQERMSAYRAA